MTELILHPNTKSELDEFIRRPAHAALIVGSEGTGKMTLARYLATQILKLPDIKALNNYPYFQALEPSGQSISIETIRELLGFTKLKTATSGSMQRVIIINEAQTMTTEAQNALLKLLEEPPEGTLILLTVDHIQHLLTTVRSRAQHLLIKQPSQQDLEQYFIAKGFPQQQVRSAILMSGGLPGLLHALLNDGEDHPLLKVVEQARDILRASTFERLAAVDVFAKQKTDCSRLLFVLQQMAHAAITQAAGKKATPQTVKQWHRILTATYEAQTTLQTGAQTKLVLTNMMLAL